MFKIFDVLPGWAYVAIIAVLAVTCFGLKSTLDHTKTTLAESKTTLEKLRADYALAALDLSETNRRIGAQRVAAKGENDETVAKERSITADVIRAAADTRSLLVSATAAITAARSTSTIDPTALARAEERAATFGQLVVQCDAVAAELGQRAEDLGTQVRGLQRAYASLTERVGRGLGSHLDLVWFGGSPLADLHQVDPHVGAGRRIAVDPTLPVAAPDPGLDGKLAFFGEEPQVRLVGDPPLQGVVNDEVHELVIGHL